MTIGWALLGPGRHAGRNVAAQMRRAAGTRLVAVVSRDRERGEAFAQEHGFERAFTSLEEALRDASVQAIYDATPDALHAGNVLQAAAAGRHCLVEKPLAHSSIEAQRAVDACRARGVQLGAVFNQRHEAAHREARRLVQSGEIGEVVFVRVQVPLRPAQPAAAPAGGNWRADRSMRPGGILWSIGDHAFDTLEWICGQAIREVSAMSDVRSGDAQTDAPPERSGALLLKLSGGAIGYASTSSRAPFARRPFEIQGTKGSILLHNTYAYLSGADEDPRPALELVTDAGRRVQHFEPTECFRLEVERFNRAIEGREAPMTPGEEGIRAVRVCEAIYESLGSGRTVMIGE